MWILIRADLPTTGASNGDGTFRSIPPPPYASIHWATPWADQKIVAYQKKREAFTWGDPVGTGRKRVWELAEDRQTTPDDLYVPTGLGLEPNYAGAVRIRWDGEDLRVFPHEYTKLDAEAMRMFVLGLGDGVTDPSHELVMGEVPETTLLKGMLDSDLSFQYDAALIDGCTPEQATAMLLGQDITDEDADIPPMGWYRLQEVYADLVPHFTPMHELIAQMHPRGERVATAR